MHVLLLDMDVCKNIFCFLPSNFRSWQCPLLPDFSACIRACSWKSACSKFQLIREIFPLVIKLMKIMEIFSININILGIKIKLILKFQPKYVHYELEGNIIKYIYGHIGNPFFFRISVCLEVTVVCHLSEPYYISKGCCYFLSLFVCFCVCFLIRTLIKLNIL